MLAKTSFRKVRKSLVNTVSKMTWDFSGGPEGRSKDTFFEAEIVQRAVGRALLSPKTASGPGGVFFYSREASLKDPLSPKSCKMCAEGARNQQSTGLLTDGGCSLELANLPGYKR